MRPGVRYWRRKASTSSREGPAYGAGWCGDSGRETLRVEVLTRGDPNSVPVAAPFVAMTTSFWRKTITSGLPSLDRGCGAQDLLLAELQHVVQSPEKLI